MSCKAWTQLSLFLISESGTGFNPATFMSQGRNFLVGVCYSDVNIGRSRQVDLDTLIMTDTVFSAPFHYENTPIQIY